MKPLTPALASVFAALLIGAFPTAAAVATPSTPGALQMTKEGGTLVDMPLRHTRVSIEVTAFVARATIEQIFENPFDEPVEAVYTFPLGDRAAVDDFELSVGDRTIRGEIKRREDARAVYEAARSAGYQAALLEQERPNVFTQSVANLEPGKEITVRLRTVETLSYERGVYRLAFPLVVGPRYVPGGRALDASKINPPALRPEERSGHDVEIAVALDAGVPIAQLSSPSHRVLVEKQGSRAARVRLAPDDTIPNKDFLLRWSVASERPAVALLAHREAYDGFFTLLVQPKGEVSPLEAAPKEIVFVVDTSGSMSGIPLDASKRLIAKALHALGPRDTFNVIRFAGDNEVFSNDPLPGDREPVERAIAWVGRQQGGGGTEMLPALRAAFARPPDPNRVRVVVFLTDGYIGNEAEILAEIGKVLGQARIYTVGIGSSVNRYLLDRMADLGRGAFVAVRPDESADDALEAFRSWVTRPYLTDLSVDWGALPVADLAPERLADLGSGQTLTLVGRYLAAGEGEVVVRGRLGGAYWEQRHHVVLPEREPRHEALAALWARGRIEGLLRETPDSVPDSTRAEVIALALEYRLMSPYTSFVAVDDARVVNPSGTSPTVRQAVPLPEGVSFEGIFGKDGPWGWRADRDDAEPEDVIDEAPGGTAGGVTGGWMRTPTAAPPPRALANTRPPVERAMVAAERKMVAPGAADMTSRFSSEFVQDLPVAGRFYQNVLSLPPGEEAEPRERLLDAAFRVLADLAYDGKLSPSEGRPALAALLGAQRPSGAIADDVAVHAVATWALAEASAVLPRDTWVATARSKAVDYLSSLALKDGWPARPGGAVGAEATRWARLVMGAIRPSSIASIPKPKDDPSGNFAKLTRSLTAGRGSATALASGRAPFDRLVATVGRGHLKVVRG